MFNMCILKGHVWYMPCTYIVIQHICVQYACIVSKDDVRHRRRCSDERFLRFHDVTSIAPVILLLTPTNSTVSGPGFRPLRRVRKNGPKETCFTCLFLVTESWRKKSMKMDEQWEGMLNPPRDRKEGHLPGGEEEGKTYVRKAGK